MQPVVFETSKDLVTHSWNDSELIDVIDANQPLTLQPVCFEETANGGDQRTEVQRTRR